MKQISCTFLFPYWHILSYVYWKKKQKIGVWKLGRVDGLRVKVHPAWKRQIAQQVGAVSEQCALVFGGKALVDLVKGCDGAAAVTDLFGGIRG